MGAGQPHRYAPLSRIAGLADTVFPPACPVCRADTASVGHPCAQCWAEISFLDQSGCRHCNRPIPGAREGEDWLACDECLRHPPLWDRGRAVFVYDGTGRRMVLSLKHGDRLDLVPTLARWAVRASGDLLTRADLIAPVPLHWTRRLKRRGNHAAWLARRMAIQAGNTMAYAPEALRRVHRTPSQDGKSRDQRVENLKGAFSLSRGVDLTGKSVLLVDDVLTTGATLNALAAICKQAGAAAVDIIVLALVHKDRVPYMAGPTEDETDDED